MQGSRLQGKMNLGIVTVVTAKSCDSSEYVVDFLRIADRMQGRGSGLRDKCFVRIEREILS